MGSTGRSIRLHVSPHAAHARALADADSDPHGNAKDDRGGHALHELAETHPNMNLEFAALPQLDCGHGDLGERREKEVVGEDIAAEQF